MRGELLPISQLGKMGLTRNCFLFICLIMALTAMPHLISAQNSPQDFVNAHNPSRAEVHTPPLVWDNKVASYAQWYANVRSKDCELVHSNGPYGENIAWASWDVSAKEAVGFWTNEKKFYNYASNSCIGGDCLHYTQVVWRTSARVGCARARCVNGHTFVTCNYDPPGNYIGERPY